MKFGLWKLTSFEVKETSCFSPSDYLMTAVSLQHAHFGILVFATLVGSVVEGAHRHGSQGMRTMLPSWLNFPLLIASLPTYCFCQSTQHLGLKVDGDIIKTSVRVLPQMLHNAGSYPVDCQVLGTPRKMWKIHIFFTK